MQISPSNIIVGPFVVDQSAGPQRTTVVIVNKKQCNLQKKQGNLQRNMVVDIKTVQLSISRLPWKSFEDKKENCRLDIELLLLVFTCSSILLVELFCLEHLTSTTTAGYCKLP